MGLFWLFLFRFRNNRIHGISISKRKLLHVSDLDRYFHSNFFNHKPAATGAGSRVGFPAKNFNKRTRILSILSKPHYFHSVHSAIRSRMNGMIFRSFRKRNSSQKNTNTVYSDYSYSGIVPKERAHTLQTFDITCCFCKIFIILWKEYNYLLYRNRRNFNTNLKWFL